MLSKLLRSCQGSKLTNIYHFTTLLILLKCMTSKASLIRVCYLKKTLHLSKVFKNKFYLVRYQFTEVLKAYLLTHLSPCGKIRISRFASINQSCHKVKRQDEKTILPIIFTFDHISTSEGLHRVCC